MGIALCAVFFNIACAAGGAASALGSQAAGTLASGFLGYLAGEIQKAITWLFTNSTDFWVRLPSPDLATQSAIGAARQWLLPLAGAVAAGGMVAAGIRMALTRRANPLLDVGTGLGVIAAAGTLGVLVPNLLLQAGDTWSSWILQESTGGQFSSRVSDLLSFGTAPDAIVVVFGIIALLLGAVQAALMLFRQAAIVVLAAVLPLAAAGATAPITRPWIRKIISWMLALICYKPAAAAVYATAFTMIGTKNSLQTTLMGFVMIALSLVALPVLMRFFTWTTGSVATGGSGGLLLGMAGAAAGAMGAARGTGGTSASDHAGYLAARQPSSGPVTGRSTEAASAGTGAPPSAGGTGPGDSRTSQAPGTGADGRRAAEGASAPRDARAATDSGGTATAAAGAGSAGTASGANAGAGGWTGPAAGAGYGAGVRGGGAGSAAPAAAGPVAAAILAGQALATGARSAATTAATEGDPS
jgi:hypothetical protein